MNIEDPESTIERKMNVTIGTNNNQNTIDSDTVKISNPEPYQLPTIRHKK